MNLYNIAIDIGGTEIKAAVFNQQLKFIDYIKIQTPNNVDTFIKDTVYELVAMF